MPSDPCGLSDFNRIERYGRAELFLTLIGTGATRSLYALTTDARRPARCSSTCRWRPASTHSLFAGGRRASRVTSRP